MRAPPVPEERGGDQLMVVGQDMDGRFLQVAFIFSPADVIYVIHARPLTDREKHRVIAGGHDDEKAKAVRPNDHRRSTEATKDFDREFVADTFGPLSRAKPLHVPTHPAARSSQGWRRRKINISIERSLLKKTDALAKRDIGRIGTHRLGTEDRCISQGELKPEHQPQYLPFDPQDTAAAIQTCTMRSRIPSRPMPTKCGHIQPHCSDNSSPAAFS